MGHIRQIFDRAANAIVQASELAVKVSELSHRVDELNSEMEKVRRNNLWLDEQLTTVRDQRDTAKREASEAKAELAKVNSELDIAHSRVNALEGDIQHHKDRLAQAISERDDYGLKQMETSDALAAATAKLSKLREALGVEEEKHEPVAQPVHTPPQAQSEPIHYQELPQSPAHEHDTGEANEAPHRVYEDEAGYDYTKPSQYDIGRNRYWQYQ
jgi:chromosome segregation ATPase